MIISPTASLRRLVCILLVASLLLTTTSGPAAADDPESDAQRERVEALLSAMPLEQRVGQMFMVSVSGEGLPEPVLRFLQAMTPGAIAMFSSNGTAPGPVTSTINGWQAVATQIGAGVPLIIAIDHEGGPVTRFTEGFTSLPWGAALGAMPEADAGAVGALAAAELRAVGINMNLAPVVDVRVPTGSGVPLFMEDRAFGADPARVGSAAAAYVQGLQAGGVIGTLKHFPGHGSAGDSHRFLPVVTSSREALDLIELAPFRAGIEAGAEVVMVGHLSVPALDPEPNRPASLSSRIVRDVLRGELGFQGVVMTDAMDMRAITAHYNPAAAAVLAVQAGIDLIAIGPTMSAERQLAMKQAVVDAVASGEIAEAQIAESVRRILLLKARYDLLDWAPLDPATAADRVGMAAHQESLYDIYLNTVAVGYDFVELLPLQPDAMRIGLAYPGVFPGLGRACSATAPSVRLLTYTLDPTSADVSAIRQMAAQVDVVVIFTHDIAAHPRQALLVNSVPQIQAIVVALRSPYDFERGIAPIAYLAAFNPAPQAFRATCAVLFGQHEASGRFPLPPG